MNNLARRDELRAKLRENSVEKAKSLVTSLKRLSRRTEKTNKKNWKNVGEGQPKDAATLSRLLNI